MKALMRKLRPLWWALAVVLSAVATAADPAAGAVTDTLTIASPLLKTPMRVTVTVPSHAPGAKLPAVYMLNGSSGSYRDWHAKMGPRLRYLSELYGVILVCPDGRDSWYWDTRDAKMETFLTTDLVATVDRMLPTDPRPAKRAITGLSMGGHGAVWLASRHPDVWAHAGTMSGAVDIRVLTYRDRIRQLLGPAETEFPAWEDHAAVTAAKALKPGDLHSLIIDCGQDDYFAGVNRQLHQQLQAQGVKHDYTERPGAHDWDYWRNAVLYQLLFFNEAFSREK